MEVEVLTVKFYSKRTLKHKKLFLTGESCIISQWLENNSEDSNKEKKKARLVLIQAEPFNVLEF